MMDGIDDSPDLLAEDRENQQIAYCEDAMFVIDLSDDVVPVYRVKVYDAEVEIPGGKLTLFISTKDRTDVVDLTDTSLLVDISDSLSERDKVKFTVHTKTTLPQFQKPEMSVVRQHEEFVWLHERFVENEDYAGVVIPPPPPRPDFDASREKLQRLGEGEATMSKEEFFKMKQELEAEYLATFKKTVAMHEGFLQRLAAHPSLRTDVNFEVFLQYEGDLSVRSKNKKEKLGGFFSRLTKTVDEQLLSGQRDVDEFFEQEKVFLVEYHNRLKDATLKSDKMTRVHKNMADSYIQISTGMVVLATIENTQLNRIFTRLAEALEKARVAALQQCLWTSFVQLPHHQKLMTGMLDKNKKRKLEGRVASDEDLKLSDTLRYYVRDTAAVKDLLYRRTRSLADYEAANKALDKARNKNKDMPQAEKHQELCCSKFEKISEVGRKEIVEFKSRRIIYFKKQLVDLVELELRHAKAQVQLLKNCITALEDTAS